MGFIYTLIDPITKVDRYVGLTTKSIDVRYKDHLIYKSKPKTHKTKWVEGLRKNGLKPIIEILDEVPDEEIKFWEMHYISLFKSWGLKLVNGTNGGDGTFGYKYPPCSDRLREIRKNNALRRHGNLRVREKKAAKTPWKQNPIYTCKYLYNPYIRSNIKTLDVFRNRKYMMQINNPMKIKSVVEKNLRKVYQYSMDGKLIKIWNTGQEAQISCNGKKWGSVNGTLNGRHKSGHGYFWSYAELNNNEFKTNKNV